MPGDAAVMGDTARREVAPPPAPTPVPAPWAGKDIGNVGAVRGEARGGGIITLRAGGTDLLGAADGFYFLSQRVRGDFEIVARVRSLQLADPETRAGIMVRANDTDPGAPNVCLCVVADPMRGGTFQYRAAAAAATTVGPADPGVRAGQWLRLTRKGRTIATYRSGNRLNWLRVGSVDLDLPVDVVAGVAVTARNAAMATTAEVDALRLQNLDGQAATRDWMLDDLGGIGASAVYNGATLTLSGTSDSFSLLTDAGVYAFQPTSGNQSLTVKVAALMHPVATARVGLMIREGPPVVFQRTQPAAIISVTVGMGVQFQSRASNNLMATVAPIKDGVRAPVWLRLERTDDPAAPFMTRVTGSFSLDGVQWTVVGSAVVPLPEPYLLGVMGTSAGSATPVTAALTDLAVGAAGPPPPSPPPPDAARPPDAAGDHP
jgi:hypothetical protein